MQLRTKTTAPRYARTPSTRSAQPRPRASREISELEALAATHASLVEVWGSEVVVDRATRILNTLEISELQAERESAKELLRAIQRLKPGCGYPVIAHGGLVEERISPRMRFWLQVQDELLQAGLV